MRGERSACAFLQDAGDRVGSEAFSPVAQAIEEGVAVRWGGSRAGSGRRNGSPRLHGRRSSGRRANRRRRPNRRRRNGRRRANRRGRNGRRRANRCGRNGRRRAHRCGRNRRRNRRGGGNGCRGHRRSSKGRGRRRIALAHRGLQHGSCARVTDGGGAIDQRLRFRIEAGETKREAGEVSQGARLEGHDPPFAADDGNAVEQRDLEAEDDALRARLSTQEHHAGPRERLDFFFEKLVFRLVRSRHSDCDRLARVVGHGARIR